MKLYLKRFTALQINFNFNDAQHTIFEKAFMHSIKYCLKSDLMKVIKLFTYVGWFLWVILLTKILYSTNVCCIKAQATSVM